MGNKRIHELAKDLSLSNADLIQKISEWKLMPGRVITASNGLEDYMIEEIKRRLAQGADSPAGGPQVVRRRKKNADSPEPLSDDQPGPDNGAKETEEVKEAGREPSERLVPTVKPRQKKSEPATIIATLTPSQFKDSQVKKAVPATAERKPPAPNFRKLPEAPPQPQAAAIEKDLNAEDLKAAEPEKPRIAPSAPPSPPQADEAGRAADPAPAAPVARKITRELGEPPARIISPPRNFDAARVIGSKPNWKDAPGGGRPGGGRPQGAPGRRPAGEGGPAAAGARRGATGDGRSPMPSRGGADFRRPEPAAVPPPEAENTRRRGDKKKKTGGGARFEGDEGLAKSRRREVDRTDLYSEGDWERVRRRGKNAKKLPKAKPEITVPKAIKRRIKVDEAISVSELAHRLSIKAGDIIKKLMAMGVLANLNQALDFDTASIVASEFGYEVERSSFDEENILQLEYGEASPETIRPPVVTIMGHVDHGKTSLLDYIRKTNIQSGEAGGITQHIGAYHVRAGGRNITFLDTPGHEAFTAMRSRGAQVTDIVILIVAADDGLMPQTREAADHAKAAGVPIIVAINKIDKPAADPERVRREMMEIGLVAEAWGGDTVFVEISAKTGQGVDELLDMILLQADMLDLKARPDGQAKGRIIEARLDKGRGPVATVLVQEGLLKQGDTYVCGVFYGRIRAMLDDQGLRVTEAGPAIPVEVHGISGVPQAGDEFIALEDEKQARQVSQHRLLRQRESELTKTSRLTLENLFDNIKAGAVKALNLIVKTDVQGSLEAIVDAVSKFSTPEIKIQVIHQSTGAVSETDILLASASNALIICFGVRPPGKVQEMADAEHIQIRYYDVIYKLIDDIKEAMAGMLAPVRSEKILGRAEVRATFAVSKVGTIAGSYVLDGKIVRGAKARLLRDGVVIHDGRLSSLKRLKDDAKEVLSGYECGIGFESYNDIKIGDHIEVYQVEETAATVDMIDEALDRAAKEKERADREKAAEDAQ